MRGKLPAFFIALLVISPLYQLCKAQFMDLVGFTSSVRTLKQIVELMYDKFLNDPEKANETLPIVDKMNEDVNSQLAEISESMEELPSLINRHQERNNLKYHINNIGFVFKRVVMMQKKIENSSREEDMFAYTTFRNEYEQVIDKDIDEIQRTLLDYMRTNFLNKTAIERSRMYVDVCRTGRSHQQFLDSILTTLKIVIAQYYLTKNKMYDFVLHFSKNPHTFDNTRTILRNKVQGIYDHAVRELKEMTTTASRELWKCDAPKIPRYQNKPDDPYHELMAFSKYIINETVFDYPTLACSDVKCHDVSNKRVDRYDYVKDKLRTSGETRKCPNDLVGCSDLHWSIDQTSSICINNDINAQNRYTGLVPGDQSSQLSCPNGRHETVRGCKFCQCTCPEKIYYISTERQWNPMGCDGRVVTGARLVVENQTIFVQIQLGLLMANGMIEPGSADWEPLSKGPRTSDEKIDWEGIRSIDLTSVTLPSDRVVIGMQFVKSYRTKESNRIHLGLLSCKFNFKTGGLFRCLYDENTKNPPNQLSLVNVDVPTNSNNPNLPDSDEDDFVTFTTTSMEKDGGQTTIPFIDTQKIVTNPPSPISGAGLYHRGQPGYGGFLALKIFTLDIIDYIKEEVDFPEL